MDEETAMRRLRGCSSHESRSQCVAEIFLTHRDRLKLMVELRLPPQLRARIDPSDVLQDAFLDVLRRLDEYLLDIPMPLFLWLRRLTAQRLVSLQRKHLGAKGRDARCEVSLETGLPVATSVVLAERLVGQKLTPSQASIREETKGKLHNALENMDSVEREVLVLRHFEGLTNREAAATLGLTEAAASKRYFRAVERLRKVLASMGIRSGED